MFDQISSQLEELSEALPRLHALVDVLHTPRLHEALRGIYEKYIDFCFVVMKFLNMKCFCKRLPNTDPASDSLDRRRSLSVALGHDRPPVCASEAGFGYQESTIRSRGQACECSNTGDTT